VRLLLTLDVKDENDGRNDKEKKKKQESKNDVLPVDGCLGILFVIQDGRNSIREDKDIATKMRLQVKNEITGEQIIYFETKNGKVQKLLFFHLQNKLTNNSQYQ